jgi:hypothetical protein
MMGGYTSRGPGSASEMIVRRVFEGPKACRCALGCYQKDSRPMVRIANPFSLHFDQLPWESMQSRFFRPRLWLVAVFVSIGFAGAVPGCSGGEGPGVKTGGLGGDAAAGGGSGKSGGTTGGDDVSFAGNSSGAAPGSGSAPSAGGTSNPGCRPRGGECEFGSDCCSGQCNDATGRCVQDLAACSPAGAACESGTECCTLHCDGGVCSSDPCEGDGQDCGGNSECCSGSCEGGKCADINGSASSCSSAGNSCGGDSDCCSKLCVEGSCAIGSSFCVQTFDICTDSDQCCHGTCVIQEGANAGYCGTQVSSGSSCDNKLVTGEVCDGDCSLCCSRSCAAHPISGKKICQPPSGCRPSGELCRTDLDCCGGDPDADLPGAGNAHCEDINDQGIGRCKSISCTPQGGICKYDDADYVAFCGGNSTSPNNCCNFLGASSNCALDRLNIPRCDALSECRQDGESCATSDDCCGGVPCVQNEAGSFVCYDPPGGGECVPSSGPCTIDGDCCRGSLCIRLPGEPSGVCGNTTVDPPGGVGGGGGEGNSETGGSGSGSESGGNGSGTGGGLSCSAFGQGCEIASDCCGGLPCDGGICNYILE